MVHNFEIKTADSTRKNYYSNHENDEVIGPSMNTAIHTSEFTSFESLLISAWIIRQWRKLSREKKELI